MRGLLAGAALALGGLVVGLAFATNVDVQADAKWWELMTAFGTVGAVVVALFIPIRQRRDALRDAEVTRLQHEWFMSEEAVRLIRVVREILTNWATNQGKPPAIRIATVISEMTNARLGSVTPSLRYTLGNIVDVVGQIQEAVARTTGRSSLMDGLSGTNVHMAHDCELGLQLEIVERIRSDFLSEFDRLKVRRPV